MSRSPDTPLVKEIFRGDLRRPVAPFTLCNDEPALRVSGRCKTEHKVIDKPCGFS
jgi:hypothetical protein